MSNEPEKTTEQPTPPSEGEGTPEVGDDTLIQILSELKTLNASNLPAPETPPEPEKVVEPEVAELPKEPEKPAEPEKVIQWPRDLNDEIDDDEKAGR